MPLPPLPTKTTLAAIATKATPTCTSSSLSTAQPVITTNDNINSSPTPPAGRKIRIISSCNYTNPMIRLNLKNLNPNTVTSTTTASPACAPKTPARDQVPKVQAAPHSVSSSFPVSTLATPDPSQASLTSTSKQTTPMKSTQTVANTIKSSNSTYSSNGSSSNSNFSLSPDYDGDLSDKAGTTDEPDPDPDLHHRRRLAQPQLNRSPSLPHPRPLLTEQQNQSQEPEVTSSVDGEDPFKELGLKPYSPIWLSSRTPSFEMMRQRSYSPNPRHRMTICPSQVQDDDDVIGKNDREILGFDLHEPLKEEVESTKNQITAAGNETKEPGSNHRYERFGSIKKRPSPLLPNHYDDLEDHDAEEVNLQLVDAKTITSTTKRPRRDYAEDQSHAPPPPPLLRPHANNSNIATMSTPTANNLLATSGSLPRSITLILTISHTPIDVIHSNTKISKATTIRTTIITTTTTTRSIVHTSRDHGPPTTETTTGIQVSSITPEMDPTLATVATVMRGASGFAMKERSSDDGEDVVAVLVVDEEEGEEAMVILNSTIDTTSLLAKVVATEQTHLTSSSTSIALRMKTP
ncbi:hypothetical protein BGZ90_001528 [Linnemannia elongata]|nr:hypothetical protein BGZ90_001528 [Linnemannia elongata]